MIVSLPVCPIISNVSPSTHISMFQIAVVISSIYWTLLLAFPTLILPSLPIDPSEPSSSGAAPALARIPLSVDVSLHAVPAISLLLDFLFFERKYSKKAAYALGPVLALAYAVGYGWWVEYCAKHNGVCELPPTVGPVFIFAMLTHSRSPLSISNRKSLRCSCRHLWRSNVHRDTIVLGTERPSPVTLHTDIVL